MFVKRFLQIAPGALVGSAFLAPLMFASQYAYGQPQPIIEISVEGIATTNGDILAALYDEGSWNGKPLAVGLVSASASAVSLRLQAPAPGRYGIAIFQDLDGDMSLDRNLLGIPTEPFGFSNNAPANFGPPSFGSAAFDVGAAGASQTISLH